MTSLAAPDRDEDRDTAISAESPDLSNVLCVLYALEYRSKMSEEQLRLTGMSGEPTFAKYAGFMIPGVRYHHVGIPTAQPREGERYLPHLKMHVSGFETSAFGVEWIRFDPDCALPELVKNVPHVAFEVGDLGTALEGRDILIEANSPSPGVTVAFIVENGAPIEFLQFAPG